MHIFIAMADGSDKIERRTKFLEVINAFASDLLKANTVDDVVWLVAKQAIAKLGFVDCVVYLKHGDGCLYQVAAHGPKNPVDFDIHHKIVLQKGQGICGSVAISGLSEIVNDTSVDSRYVLDDSSRLSEITVPIILDDEVIGIIDSEHPERNYFTQEDLEILETIASMTAVKLGQIRTQEKIRNKLEEEVSARTKDLEETAEKLRQSLNKEKELGELKSRFVSSASHQFRTPLTVIRMNVSLFKTYIEQNGPIDRLPQITSRICEEIDKMTDLMDSVLIIGKIGSGKQDISLSDVITSDIVEHVVEQYNSIQDDGRQILIQTKGQPRNIPLDVKLIEHALSNIVSNAFKYSKGRPSPIIDVSYSKDEVVITIKDFGKGINVYELNSIFTPFFRGENVIDIEGTGMGMSIAKEYIELNGGTISVESLENEWTEFKIQFPF